MEDEKKENEKAVPVEEATSVPSSAETSRPLPPPKQDDTALSADVARILEEVKLPERKSVRTAGDAKRAPQPVAPKQPPQHEAASSTAEPAAKTSSKKSDLPPVRTFRDDLHRVVSNKKISLVRATALEEQKRASGKKITPSKEAVAIRTRTRKRRVIIGLAVAILIMLGALALGVVGLVVGQRSTDAAPPPVNSLIFSENTVGFPLTPNTPPRTIRQQLQQARFGTTLTLGAVTRIVPLVEGMDAASNPTEPRPATTAEFMAAIGAQAPEGLIRSLGSDFFLGIHTIDENVPLMVFTVSSYERAFAGMLAWEDTLNDSFAPLFTLVPHQTQLENGQLELHRFEDLVVRNYDVRVLRDASGNVQMLYGFPTRSIMVIAESTHSFVEALSRLRAERRI